VLTRRWRAATVAGETSPAEQAAAGLRQTGTGQRVQGSPQSEPGTDRLHPLLEATKVEGGGRLNGRKIFGTLSPAATLRHGTCRVRDSQGGFRRGLARVPRERAGVEIKHNWDALGMRASGSHDLVFQDCFVPEAALREDGPWGAWTEGLLSGQMAFNI